MGTYCFECRRKVTGTDDPCYSPRPFDSLVARNSQGKKLSFAVYKLALRCYDCYEPLKYVDLSNTRLDTIFE